MQAVARASRTFSLSHSHNTHPTLELCCSLSASEAAPSIIFMDEIDSIGGARSEGSKGGDSEVQRTMLELLNQLDGFEPAQNIKVRPALHTTELTFLRRSSCAQTFLTCSTSLCRSSCAQTELTFWTRHCCDLAALTAKSSSQTPQKRCVCTKPHGKQLRACSPCISSRQPHVHVLHTLVQAREHILKIHSRRMNLMRGINLKKVASKMNSASGAECKVRHHTGTTLAPHLLRYHPCSPHDYTCRLCAQRLACLHCVSAECM